MKTAILVFGLTLLIAPVIALLALRRLPRDLGRPKDPERPDQ